jgi:hypothetical protein
LTAISFPATNHLHRCLATEIQKFLSFSMTGATSLSRRFPHHGRACLDRRGHDGDLVATATIAIVLRSRPGVGNAVLPAGRDCGAPFGAPSTTRRSHIGSCACSQGGANGLEHET